MNWFTLTLLLGVAALIAAASAVAAGWIFGSFCIQEGKESGVLEDLDNEFGTRWAADTTPQPLVVGGTGKLWRGPSRAVVPSFIPSANRRHGFGIDGFGSAIHSILAIGARACRRLSRKAHW